MPKRKSATKTRKRLYKRGFVTLFLVLAVIILGILLSGFYAKFGPPKPFDAPQGSSSLYCCDSGNGDACTPATDDSHTFEINGERYGLLKSNITLKEVVIHLRDTGQKFNGDPIIENTSEEYNPGHHEGCNGEALWGPDGQCVITPNNEVLYVCRKNCDNSYNQIPQLQQVCQIQGVSCFGNPESVYDAYFRLNDVSSPGIPDVIKNCKVDDAQNSTPTTPAPLEPTIVIDKFQDQKDLQLETFKLIYPTPGESTTNWLSPWCKPAVYLYPTHKTQVTVKVNSKQPLTYTDPLYPSNGWTATADTNGDITYQDKNYDYLYYETKIADSQIEKPKEGFVISKADLNNKLSDLMPKLGLNSKETKQFVEYWTNALPDSPYYLVGITPRQTLDNAASLSIYPKPDTIIRVGLYFETLKSKINIPTPNLSSPARKGFTVVEWGGIFKKHPGEEFSCFM
ncbi:MAG TPA: hypothetical protein VG917_05040 [Patescibacteria group bacterium]|nr:hypothetical protein [Patescibacteria group bacterium]